MGDPLAVQKLNEDPNTFLKGTDDKEVPVCENRSCSVEHRVAVGQPSLGLLGSSSRSSSSS